MQEQLRNLRADCKGKGSSKSAHTMDELKYLMDFNSSISQAAAKTMEHLSEFVFISMGNLTLARRDAYLTHVKSGIKPDTIAALRTAPLHIPTLFPDAVIKRAEEEITNLRPKVTQTVPAAKAGITLMIGLTGNLTDVRIRRGISRHGKTLGKAGTENLEERLLVTPPDQPRASSLINDNYCVTQSQTGLLAGSTYRKTIDTCLPVNLNVVTPVPTVPGLSQKKDLSPGPVGCCTQRVHSLKHVKGVLVSLSCLVPLLYQV